MERKTLSRLTPPFSPRGLLGSRKALVPKTLPAQPTIDDVGRMILGQRYYFPDSALAATREYLPRQCGCFHFALAIKQGEDRPPLLSSFVLVNCVNHYTITPAGIQTFILKQLMTAWYDPRLVLDHVIKRTG